MGTYAYDATNDTLDLIAGRGNTDELAAKLSKTSDNIAPKQETNTASELIPVGKYFINANGDLCQCDVQIASGGTIIIGSNCHVVQGGISESVCYSLNSYIDESPWLIGGHSISINPPITNVPILIYAMNSAGNGCMFLYNPNYGQFYTIKNDGNVVTFSLNNGVITISADSTYTFVGVVGIDRGKRGFTIN